MLAIKSRVFVFCYDLIMVVAAWALAYLLRFNLEPIAPDILQQAIHLLPIIVTTQVLSFWLFGLYRPLWRYASIPDLIRMVKAIFVGSSLSIIIIFLLTRLDSLPRSVMPLYAMNLLLLLGGSRFFIRYIKDKQAVNQFAKRVLIVGAGTAGEGLVRDLRRNDKRGFNPVCFVDDNKKLHGLEIQGVRVVGKIKDLNLLVKKYDIDLIFIAIPSANAHLMRTIYDECEKTKKAVRTLPSLTALVDGRVTTNALREVSLDDLLGREQISIDWQNIDQSLKDKTVLITGAGGSIGSELCRQIAKTGLKKLVLVDNCEFNLFKISNELINSFASLDIAFYLTDIKDKASLEILFKKYKFDVIYHGAAYKHVPMLEHQVHVAIGNNVIGTKNVALLAKTYAVQKFVLVSSDKAVNPTNIMGATKRIAELFCLAIAKDSYTKFITVRFGNVLGSTGSVVPIFKEQLEAGGPITVTHPDITRFFMTIPEASQLILQASVLGDGGEIFVLDMGEQIKISYLAEQMIRLAGKKVGSEIAINYTGLRPGEKLYEELFYDEEKVLPTKHKKIHIAEQESLDANSNEFIARIEQLYYEFDLDNLKQIIDNLIAKKFTQPWSVNK